MTTRLRASTLLLPLTLLSAQNSFAHGNHTTQGQEGVLAQISHLMTSPDHLAPALLIGATAAIIGTVLVRRKSNIS